MKSFNRQVTAPANVPRTRRRVPQSNLTSLPAGKCVPLAVQEMFREDSLNAQVSIRAEMLETAEILMNRTNMRVMAYLVPWLAMERFDGSRDQFDRSYMGQPQIDGGAVVPFFETHAMGAHGSKPFYKYAGLHGKSTDEVNTMYLEAYNAIYNYRAGNRSPDLAKRTRLDTSLAPAFWRHSRFGHIVPDFDQAVIDGEVALNIVDQQLALKSTYAGVPSVYGEDQGRVQAVLESSPATGRTVRLNTASSDVYLDAAGGDLGAGYDNLRLRLPLTDIVAEFGADAVTVSLSKLDQARKAQWFARLRERFAGHDDEYIIDMLMAGLTIPDQALKDPILLADNTVTFQQVKRYATDAANLAESAVSGGALLNFRVRVPKLSVGGVVMIVAECLPDQLFERQRDPFFFVSNDRDATGELKELPSYVRDEMDEQKVDVVLNGEIDTDHATPGTTFGYEPMHARWARGIVRVGGKFYRPSTNTVTDEERQRLWAVETVNPSLSADFYIASGGVHTKPFLDTEADPFEVATEMHSVLEGNTVFGPALIEADENYDKVMEKAPTEQIEQA